ncbi:diguanylate cyclase (GGDEF)-like protein [Rhodopseudomonas julia]|uniref:Diguanylate cyclase (GGDEF)-like protein n=1 Tax=Rhodopseudomonas julia TaxID=200617 RepID=A0ABU0C775_9BRAD|nr:GGDEF domain-containing protein [Rhodopseudomonas julia]MDQ0324937.1 diguanylate cyclase (GGDEF)-like protein [Rhodopseudomonas julia]
MLISRSDGEDTILLHLLDLVYGSLPSITLILIGFVVAGTIATVDTGDQLLGLITILGFLIGLARIAICLFYRRWRRSAPLIVGEWHRWEFAYMAGGWFFSACLGALAARTLVFQNHMADVLVMTLTMAYFTGIVVRVVRPRIAVAQLLLVLLPVVAMSLTLGGPSYIALAFIEILFAIGAIQLIIYNSQTMVARLQAERSLSLLARHDHLTKLPNRAYFEEKMAVAICEAGTRGEGFALILLDLDGFKPVNDTFGHIIGDQLLRASAERIRTSLPSEAFAARIGGDEFAVIMPVGMGRAEAFARGKAILAAVAQPFTLGHEDIRIGASAGLATFVSGELGAQQLYTMADQALYQAKRQGRADICVYQEGSLVAQRAA